MNWTIFFVISVGVLLLAVTGALLQGKTKYRHSRLLNPTKLIFVGVALSALFLFIPVCYHAYGYEGGVETFLMSVYNTITIFVIGGDYAMVTESIAEAAPGIARCYSVMFAVLFVAAPVMTFGFVLSFFKNTSAYRRYISHFKSKVYIFSDLNEKSLTLAESILENDKKALLAFADVWDGEDKTDEDQIDRARQLGAICFATDILATNWRLHSKRSTINFFMIEDNQAENLENALRIVENFKQRENTNLYVFSNQVESELLLTNLFNNDNSMKIRIRRINEVQSLVYRTLYEEGYEQIFANAVPTQDGKQIHALILGMGHHGTEMAKALSWFCQMDGYRPLITCVDLSEDAVDRFTSRCPELMDPALNGHYDIPGEVRNHIQVYAGIDIDSCAFDELIGRLPPITYGFVALGNDERNIAAAVKLRMLTRRHKDQPAIQAVVYNSEKREALSGIVNFKNQAYDIQFIGDMKTTCSEKVILGSDLEQKALQRHLKWGEERHFWQYDYNYRSSVASAIHSHMKRKCGIPGAEKAPADRTPEERQNIRILEHRRWNAYMRSEGYVYSGSNDKSSRDDMAKTHHCLVPFDELSAEEQAKDDD